LTTELTTELTTRLTIRHDEGLPEGGRVLERPAVKGVALRGRDVLLLRTAEVGALKFPGGGVEPGESDEQALRRELDEECGVPLLSVGAELGQVVQLARPKEAGYDVFRMVSRYYRCAVGEASGRQRLDDYEQLGLTPVWLDVSAAAATCVDLLASGAPLPRWVERELAVLRLVEAALEGARS
jgi:8-oxo-dGTP pyrophosphatase MutT (NUDIX family)